MNANWITIFYMRPHISTKAAYFGSSVRNSVCVITQDEARFWVEECNLKCVFSRKIVEWSAVPVVPLCILECGKDGI